MLLIDFSIFPFNFSVEEISRIKLQSWLVGKNFENTAAFRIISFSGGMNSGIRRI